MVLNEVWESRCEIERKFKVDGKLGFSQVANFYFWPKLYFGGFLEKISDKVVVWAISH